MPRARTFFDFTVGEQPLGRVVVSQINWPTEQQLISSSNCIMMCMSLSLSIMLTFQSPKDSREVSCPSRYLAKKLIIVSEPSVQVKKEYHNNQTFHYITKPPPSIELLKGS